MASINITPLTDVLLVLLIIFMITAGAIQRDRIKIPTTHYKDKANETDLVVSIGRDKGIFVGAKPVEFTNLEAYLEKLAKEFPLDADGKHPHKIIIKCDKDAPYGIVAGVMDSAKLAGFTDISLATKPLEEVKKEKENAKQNRS